jgi:hypothetical protein
MADGRGDGDVDMDGGGGAGKGDAATDDGARGVDEDGTSGLSRTQLDVLVLVRDHVLPVLSLLGCNVAVANEVWEVVKDMSWKLRYSLYSAWRYGDARARSAVVVSERGCRVPLPRQLVLRHQRVLRPGQCPSKERSAASAQACGW